MKLSIGALPSNSNSWYASGPEHNKRTVSVTINKDKEVKEEEIDASESESNVGVEVG